MIKWIDSYDLVEYPQEFQSVLAGDAYWQEPIKILGHYGRFQELNTYRLFDMDHPKCYYCGKFVKKGDWWKGKYTGPCSDCYDPISRW